MLGGGIKSFLKEHRALPILIILMLGLTFGLSRLVLADTVTVKYKDESSNTQSLTLNKGSTIYLDPNFSYFTKDNDKRTKKLTLTNNLDLTNNDDININPYAVVRTTNTKEALMPDSAWGQNTTFSSIRTMQEMTPTICKAETTPTKEAVNTTAVHSTNTNLVPEARLKDTRDNKYYTVRKLADGNCWMTDNLAYAKAGTLSPTDSDVRNTNFTLASSDIYTKEGEQWGKTYDKKFIYDRSPYVFKGWRKTRLSNGDVSLKAVYNLENIYGNLYTWYTATAGSGTYSMEKGDASFSICPRGWRLPQRDGTNSYNNLISFIYGLQDDLGSSIKMQSLPLNFSFAGQYHYDDGRIYGTGRFGDYWSSTADSNKAIIHDNGLACDLAFSSNGVQLRWNLMVPKAYGLSVRCMAH